MQAYTFTALEVTYGTGADDILTVSPVEIVATFDDDVTALEYDITGTLSGDDGNATILTTPETFSVDGVPLDFSELDFYLADLSFEDGAERQVIGIQTSGFQNYLIEVSGTPLPEDLTEEDFQAIVNSVDGFADLDASPLSFGDIAGLESVEDLPTPGIVVPGTDDNDTLTGSDGDDRVEGGNGDDDLSGGEGNDGLLGGEGNDTIDGGEGNNTIAGGTGDDSISAGEGNNFLGGGEGNDVITSGNGNNTIGGGFGDDVISTGDGDNVISGGAGRDTIETGNGNNVIGGSFGTDSITTGEGSDNLGGGFGMDTIDAGEGDDSVGGGNGNDLIDGGEGDDFLAGGGRNDTIFGGEGDDTINGGDGNDEMTGGEGADVFIWNSGEEGATDTILDFEDGVDTIFLTGVENEPGSGLAGRVDALNITDTTYGEGEDAVDAATLTYHGQDIVVVGVTAADLTVEDFSFL